MGIPAPARKPVRHRLVDRWSVAAILAVAWVAMAGCAADFGAQTNQQYQPGEGISDRNNPVYILNALVVTDGKGNGTLVGTMIDESDKADALQGVTAVDANGQSISTTKLTQPIALASQAAVKLETGAAVRLTGSGLVAGDYVTVTFSFQNAAPIALQIPIIADGPIYSGIPVGPA